MSSSGTVERYYVQQVCEHTECNGHHLLTLSFGKHDCCPLFGKMTISLQLGLKHYRLLSTYMTSR